MISQKIRSFADLAELTTHSRKILTLFSGGLDSSYLLKELVDRDCEVVALAVDVGEGVQLEDLREITGYFGAQLEVIDAKEQFVINAVLPALRAQARYLGIYPISASLSRPIMAHCAVQTARRLGCAAIIHTANRSQNSLRRLNGAIRQLGFEGWFGTPYEQTAMSREAKIESLRRAGMARFEARGISGDANLWCREFESGALDNPEAFWAPESLYEWTSVRDRPATSELSIGFEQGVPVMLDGSPLPLQELIGRLNRELGAYQIGRYSGLEHLDQGEKVLEVREAPAATVLMDAYRHLETATLDAELLRVKMGLEQVWVREAIEGRWFGGLREAADAFILRTSRLVTGSVSYRLRQGAFDLCAIKASRPLYLKDRDAWEKLVISELGHMRQSTERELELQP